MPISYFLFLNIKPYFSRSPGKKMQACSCQSSYVWPLKLTWFVIGVGGRILCLKGEHRASSGSYSGKEKWKETGQSFGLSGVLQGASGHTVLAIVCWKEKNEFKNWGILHSCHPQVYPENLQCARHCSRHWRGECWPKLLSSWWLPIEVWVTPEKWEGTAA